MILQGEDRKDTITINQSSVVRAVTQETGDKPIVKKAECNKERRESELAAAFRAHAAKPT